MWMAPPRSPAPSRRLMRQTVYMLLHSILLNISLYFFKQLTQANTYNVSSTSGLRRNVKSAKGKQNGTAYNVHSTSGLKRNVKSAKRKRSASPYSVPSTSGLRRNVKFAKGKKCVSPGNVSQTFTVNNTAVPNSRYTTIKITTGEPIYINLTELNDAFQKVYIGESNKNVCQFTSQRNPWSQKKKDVPRKSYAVITPTLWPNTRKRQRNPWKEPRTLYTKRRILDFAQPRPIIYQTPPPLVVLPRNRIIVGKFGQTDTWPQPNSQEENITTK